MSALFKIPCILLAMVGVQVAVTPPHPPPSENEKAPSTTLESVIKRRAGAYTVKYLCWGAGLAESLVILSSRIPDSTVSKYLLPKLLLSPDAVSRIAFTPTFLFGAALACMGGYIRYRCYHELGKMFTFEMSIRNDHRLITTGPYSWVRHPGYSAILLKITGVVCMYASSGSWVRESGILTTRMGKAAVLTYFLLVSSITTGLLFRMPKEDEALRTTFGQTWDAWAEKVPHKLIPGIF